MTHATLVHETANAPGTNVTFNLAGPVSGRRSFAMAFATGAPAFYVIVDGVQSEWGLGTFTAGAPNTLARTTVIGNSANTTARLNFTGAVDVYNALPAEEQVAISDGPLAGFRNLVINGNPTINQRGYVSGSAVGAAGTYTLDRWRVVTSGQAVSWSDAAGIRTVTFPSGGGETVVEGASIRSGAYTLSWLGTAAALVNGSTVANGGKVTLTGGTNVTLRFSGGTASLVQLEPGPRATPFEFRPIGVELTLCQRYAAVVSHNVTAPVAGYTGVPFTFSVPMRATPTLAANIAPGTVTNCGLDFESALSPRGGLFQILGTAAGAAISERVNLYTAEL